MVPYHHTIIISSILIHQCLALNDVIYKTNLTLDGTGRSFLLIALPRKKKERRRGPYPPEPPYKYPLPPPQAFGKPLLNYHTIAHITTMADVKDLDEVDGDDDDDVKEATINTNNDDKQDECSDLTDNNHETNQSEENPKSFPQKVSHSVLPYWWYGTIPPQFQ